MNLLEFGFGFGIGIVIAFSSFLLKSWFMQPPERKYIAFRPPGDETKVLLPTKKIAGEEFITTSSLADVPKGWYVREEQEIEAACLNKMFPSSFPSFFCYSFSFSFL